MPKQFDFFENTPDVEPVKAPPALGRQQQAVLDRLRQGPATSGDLAFVTTRYREVVNDLLRRGYTIPIRTNPENPSIAIYTLIEGAKR